MPTNATELQAIGLQREEVFVAVPSEWKAQAYKEIVTKKGTFQVVRFTRPNEPDIELWNHSMEVRDGRLFVKKDHAERQDRESK